MSSSAGATLLGSHGRHSIEFLILLLSDCSKENEFFSSFFESQY